MELWSWTAAIINFAPVTYYYMLPGGKSDLKPDIKAVKKMVITKREQLVPAIAGSGKYDFEDLLFRNLSRGKISFSRLATMKLIKNHILAGIQ